jgi:hypothetical protein
MTVQQDEDGQSLPLEVSDIEEIMPADWHGVPVLMSFPMKSGHKSISTPILCGF